MKHIETALLLLISIYPFSYARYNWINNNKFGAAGVAFIGLIAVIFPAVLIYSR